MTQTQPTPAAGSSDVLPYLSPQHADQQPTNVRHSVVAVMTAAAFLMYLDRFCMSQIVSSTSFQREFQFSGKDQGWILSSFFFAYALGQLPGGWLSDRYGSRVLMTWFIALWSAFTLTTGLAIGLWTLLLTRIGCGLAEAGAYPASSGLLSRWIPQRARGRASSIVSAGGRLGGAVAPILTAYVIVWFGNWRAAGWIFGGVGIFFAWAFWVIVRNRPATHPRVNAAELDLITRGLPPEQGVAAAASKRFPIRGLVTNSSMWLMCVHQVLTNMGWAFLATWLPLYLKQAKGQDDQTSGTLSTVVLLIGACGMLFGGWLTDALTKKFGMRRGRMIPMVWTRVIGCGAYFICLISDVPLWACICAFALVAIMTDIGVPAVWAYCQDVGGRNVAAVLAWPNMWGNIGAAFTPPLLAWINDTFDTNKDWYESISVAAVLFLASGLVALGIKADRKIAGTSDEPEPRGFPVISPPTTPGSDRTPS